MEPPQPMMRLFDRVFVKPHWALLRMESCNSNGTHSSLVHRRPIVTLTKRMSSTTCLLLAGSLLLAVSGATDRPIIGVLTVPLLEGGCVSEAASPDITSCFHSVIHSVLQRTVINSRAAQRCTSSGSRRRGPEWCLCASTCRWTSWGDSRGSSTASFTLAVGHRSATSRANM